jgi:hypothetical protein
MDLNAIPFLTIIFMGIIVVIISRALDLLWSQVITVRIFYYVIRAPGVMVHELSHALGCLIMGAKIKKIVFFSKEGGLVTYSTPKLPYLGDMVIGTAPLFCIPLVLAGCTWIFSLYLGCVFPPLPLGVQSTTDLFLLSTGVIGMFTGNLIVTFNPWFLLYLYLTLTLVLSLSPSMQDIRNAALGICIITLAGLLVLWSGIPLLVTMMDEILQLVGIGFVLGLVFGITALVLSSPLMVWYVQRHC